MESSPWWIDFRRQQYKPRPIVSIGMIMRKSLDQVLKEYTHNCSVAGVKQMTATNIGWGRRCGWMVIFATLFSLVYYFLFYIWLTTLANPMILMPQYSTYSIADIDYPAVALCNVNRISKKAMQKQALFILKNNLYGNVTLKEIEEYLVNSGKLLDFSYLQTSDPPFSKIDRFRHQIKDFDTHKVIDAMKNLAPACNEMLLRCTWAGEPVDCMSIFKTRRTAKGHCCAFNYILEYGAYYGRPNKTQKAYRQVLPGFMHGLNVILDPMLHDYQYPINYIQGFDVLIFEPTHFADPSAGRVLHHFAEPNRLKFLELKSIRQIASHEVRKYPQSTRKCIFGNEKPEYYQGLYSYSACITRCRVQSMMSLCQCTPFFLPVGNNNGPICLLSDMPCLNKYKEMLTHLQPIIPQNNDEGTERDDSIHCADCLPDCEHTRHVTKTYITSINAISIDKYFDHDFTKDINLTDKCILSIYYANPGGDLEYLDVVSYWYQIISNVGGFGGVLIGISIFSLVEIVYFFCFRYPQEIYKNFTYNN